MGRQGVARDGRRVAFEFLYQKYGFSAFILPVDIAMSLSAYFKSLLINAYSFLSCYTPIGIRGKAISVKFRQI